MIPNRPALALELLPSGISLFHQTYDGQWHLLATVALDDKELARKMREMRRAARESQGRAFTCQIWISAEQIAARELVFSGTEAADAAAQIHAQWPDLADGAEIDIGAADSFGRAWVATVAPDVLEQARLFAAEHGFLGAGVSCRTPIRGFSQPPYFPGPEPLPAPPAINWRPIATAAAVLAAVATLGYGALSVFGPSSTSETPAPAETAAAENAAPAEPAASPVQDPRAPIRPTGLPADSMRAGPDELAAKTDEQAPAGAEPVSDTNRLLTGIAAPDPLGLDAAETVPAEVSHDTAQAPDTTPGQEIVAPLPDNLPAPESFGVLQSVAAPSLPAAPEETVFSAPPPLTVENARQRPQHFLAGGQDTDAPVDPKISDLLSGRSDILDEVYGLALTRDAELAKIRAERIERDQLLPPRLIEGRPNPLPLLRGGNAVPDAPPATTGADAADTTTDTAPEEESPDQITALIEEVQAAEQERRQAEAARLLPLRRPATIADIAAVMALSEGAVPEASAPRRRPDSIAARAEELRRRAAEARRTTPAFNDQPRKVQLPTSANVAREATIKDGIDLNDMSLITIAGTPGKLRALIRLPGGRYEQAKVGTVIDGWTVVAITAEGVRLKRGSKTETLRMPAAN